MKLTPSEVARWLIDADGEGSTDEEFAEVFALLYQYYLYHSDVAMDGCGFGEELPQMYDTEELIIAMDVNKICGRINKILTEIQNNTKMKHREG